MDFVGRSKGLINHYHTLAISGYVIAAFVALSVYLHFLAQRSLLGDSDGSDYIPHLLLGGLLLGVLVIESVRMIKHKELIITGKLLGLYGPVGVALFGAAGFYTAFAMVDSLLTFSVSTNQSMNSLASFYGSADVYLEYLIAVFVAEFLLLRRQQFAQCRGKASKTVVDTV